MVGEEAPRGGKRRRGGSRGEKSLPPPPAPHRHRLLGAPQCWGARVGRRSRSLPGVGAAGAGGERGRCRAEGKDGAGPWGTEGGGCTPVGGRGPRRPPQSLLAAWVGGGVFGERHRLPRRRSGRRGRGCLPSIPPRDPPPRPAAIATHAAAGPGTVRGSPLPRARPRAAASGGWGELEAAGGHPGKAGGPGSAIALASPAGAGRPGGRGERGCGRLVALWLTRVYSSVRGAGSLPGSHRTLSDIGGFSSRPDPAGDLHRVTFSPAFPCTFSLQTLSLRL